MTFVDTGAWFAFFVPSDPAHPRVRKWLIEHPHPLATTDYCVDETLTLLAARGELRRALEAGRAFFEADVAQLHFVTACGTGLPRLDSFPTASCRWLELHRLHQQGRH